MSESVSDSESCCLVTPCGCESWLTAFCDYKTLTLTYCGVTTEFTQSRSKAVPYKASNPQSAVHPTDKIFRISTQEHDVAVGIGAEIVDDEGKEWIVYSTNYLNAWCVHVLWARSIEACFGLLETIDVLEENCEDCDCKDQLQFSRRARVKGKIFTDGGSLSTRNDSREIVYQFSGELVRWPLAERPSSRHRLKGKSGSYRIVRVTDRGPFVPFIVGLEKEVADCSVRGS